MIISSHRLQGADVVHLDSPNIGDFFAENLPDTIVLHYTACNHVEEAAQILCSPEKEASAHLIISNSGEVYQLVSFDRIAWHAGKSFWDGRESINKYSIGIEIDNAGSLEIRDNKYYSWSGKEYAKEDVFLSKSGEAWHRYSDEQLLKLDVLVAMLIEHYQIVTIVGHSDIAPERKMDPGPAFPMSRYQQLLAK